MNLPENEIFKITGIMSGTSLDGADLAACSFVFHDQSLEYKIAHAVTYPYSQEWKNRLRSLPGLNAAALAQTHFDFGKLLGEYALQFHNETGFEPMLISSHGHTIFHDPEHGYTAQIGSGAAIAAIAGKPAVCDFRATDVCLSGQGAPLVPIGDMLLFHQYQACLNLGGFSNISFNQNQQRIAFDICPVNTVLNHFASKFGHEFDNKGELARQGKIIPELLDQLNKLDFYNQVSPKSLGTEWLEAKVFPLLNDGNYSVKDKLSTFTEHISIQISKVLNENQINNVLVTGGGTFNTFLIERIQTKTNCELILPDDKTIAYKEALVFALLGLLRWFGQTNCLASATGAAKDSVAGAVYLPAK